MEKITRGRIWKQGLHLEWMERASSMQFGDDVDMSAEIAEIEREAARILSGRCTISLAEDEEADYANAEEGQYDKTP